MSFDSLTFAIFLVATFVAYWSCRPRYRWIVILAANVTFYGYAGLQYLLLLTYIIVTTYWLARWFHSRHLRRQLVIGILAMVLPLVVFKYSGFLGENVNLILAAAGSAEGLQTMEIALPLGISFYTFSALAYVIDVWNYRIEPERNIGHLAAGISFFPCLISGPIERQQNLIPQIVDHQTFDYDSAVYGLMRMAWGFYKKLVIADNLAPYVDAVFQNVHSYHGASFLVASLFFTIEIYCDFSGYSDIAIGVARLFGIRLTENFRSPYFSQSIQEFWRRWHISLSTWFRDYIYIPLGGNRRGAARKYMNLLVTFLVSGLWHGASWTFVVWGGAHGVAQIAESCTVRRGMKMKCGLFAMIRMLVVFCVVSILWIFFKADTFSSAGYMIIHMLDGIRSPVSYAMSGKSEIGMNGKAIIILLFQLFLLACYDWKSLSVDVIREVQKQPVVVRWSLEVVFLIMILQCAYKGGPVSFVYAGF